MAFGERDQACAVIYASSVTDTAITFESEPPLPAEMAQRIATARRTHAWVVLENVGRVVGYAYGGPFKPRAASPNDASVGLHRALGSEPVGTYRRIGWKHDTWHDVARASERSP